MSNVSSKKSIYRVDQTKTQLWGKRNPKKFRLIIPGKMAGFKLWTPQTAQVWTLSKITTLVPQGKKMW